nr:hypothetical protein [Anaerolineae bacterium]
MLSFGQTPAVAALMAFGLLLAASVIGALLVLLWVRLSVRESIRKGTSAVSQGVKNIPPVQSFARFKYRQVV